VTIYALEALKKGIEDAAKYSELTHHLTLAMEVFIRKGCVC